MRDKLMKIIGPMLLLFAMSGALLLDLLPEIPMNNNKNALTGGYE